MKPKSSLHTSAVLKLNGCWQAIGYMTVREAFRRLFSQGSDVLKALEIEIDEHGNVGSGSQSFWGHEWFKLEVGPTDNWIGLPNGKRMRIPLVAIVPHYRSVPKLNLQLNRRGLYTREKGRCAYCQELLPYDNSTVDHIIPVSRWPKTKGKGPDTWENCVLACKGCNARKGDKTPEEAGMPLHKLPRKPMAMPTMPGLLPNAPAAHLAILRAA
jgi:5-methylcytosine-specific restriction endonuclease McrA